MTDIPLKPTWFELLGEDSEEYSEEDRRARWEEWKQLARDAGDDEMVDYWSDHGECGDCVYKDGDWCRLMGLPVTINPILTMRHGMIGFACMGAGHEEPGQKEIEFEEETKLPF